MRLLVWLVGLVWSRNCRLAHSGTFEVNHEENLEVEAGEYRYQSRELQNLPKTRQKYDGVAATLFLGSPKWFQQRYSLMINQMKSALPISWIIQIFYLPHNAMAEEAIQYHGIRKNILSGHVILTPISSSVGRKVRKKDLLRMPWFWRNLLADRVLLFGGNAVLCGSSPYSLQDFLSYDYVGAQWNILRGVGGSGELSLRNRTAVLEFIQSQGGDQYHLLGKDPEDIALAKGLANVAPQEVSHLHLNFSFSADSLSRKVSLRFAVTRTGGDPHPFGLSGTLAGQSLSLLLPPLSSQLISLSAPQA
jgi:hypothetical protein